MMFHGVVGSFAVGGSAWTFSAMTPHCSRRNRSSAAILTVHWRCVAYGRRMPSAYLSKVVGLATLSMMQVA